MFTAFYGGLMRTIKRYSNRKLYDTRESHYVSLDDILALVREGEDVEVVDSRTGEELTSVVLAQAMAEEEKSGGSGLPIETFKELIKRGNKELGEIMRKSRLAGKGAVQMAEESTAKYYRKLIRRGEVSEDEARSYLKSLSRKVMNRRRSLDGQISDRVTGYIGALQLPTRSDLDNISKKIDSIARKLDNYISQSSPPKKRTRKK